MHRSLRGGVCQQVERAAEQSSPWDGGLRSSPAAHMAYQAGERESCNGATHLAWHALCTRGLVTPNHRPKAPTSSHSAFRKLTLKQRARVMRRSPTDSEAALWQLLKGRQLGVSFKRQVPLLGYIVDFYASAAKLVVEVDGGYHAERVALDAKRQRRLELAGYRVVRVASDVVLRQPEGAVECVRASLAG